jgi:hypothetical protein
MFILTVILAVIALTALAVFALLIISIHGEDRALSLRRPPACRIDAFTRRVLGACSDYPANGTFGGNARYHQAGR